MALIFVLLLNCPAEKVIQSLSESRKTIFLLVSVIVQVKINASFSQNCLKAHWDSHLSPGQPDSLASHTCLRSGHFSPSQMLLLKSEVRLISSGLYNLLTDAVTPSPPAPTAPCQPRRCSQVRRPCNCRTQGESSPGLRAPTGTPAPPADFSSSSASLSLGPDARALGQLLPTSGLRGTRFCLPGAASLWP